jgi:hypothetical protein
MSLSRLSSPRRISSSGIAAAAGTYTTGVYSSLRSSLTNYWPLNEEAPSGSNTTAANWVSGGTNMTSDNAVPSIAGKSRNGRSFTRANSQRMSATANSSMTICGTSNYTLAFWFRMDSAPATGNYGLVSNDFFSTERGISVYIGGDAVPGYWAPLVFLAYTDSTNETWVPFVSVGVAASAWTFVCLRLSGGTAIDYRLNSTDAPTKTLTKSFNSSRQRLFFGTRYTAADYLNGSLDEVAMWSRRLSDAEVNTLYNDGNGIDLRR